jgi:hypothetical protein
MSQSATRKPEDSKNPNIESSDWPKWDPADESRSLDELYAYARNIGQRAISWYWGKARKSRWKGRALRVVQILLIALGGLFPLLVSAGVDFGELPYVRQDANAGQWGYVSLALAGTCMLLDRFFGFSSGWIRFVTTATQIESGLAKFHMDWVRLFAARSQPPQSEELKPFLQHVDGFIRFVRGHIERETAAWVLEYRTSLTDLEQQMKERQEGELPGSLQLAVSGVERADQGVVVSVDGAPMQTITSSSCTLRALSPGQHRIHVKGSIGGQELEASDLVTIASGQVATLSIGLT